jgi:hypothetical protein
MSYTGRVHNGVIVLDNGSKLAEGTVVRVEPVQPAVGSEAGGRARFERLAGVLDDLPSDLARNHDHYLHGHPKR